MHESKLVGLARAVALELPVQCALVVRNSLSEMYHLQPATIRVAERVALTWDPVPSLVGKRFGESLGWVGLGNVDVVFHWADGSRTFLELKCGPDLSACAWDALKLGAGVL